MVDLTRILHVDDDEDIRIIAQMALQVVGDLTVLQCASGAEAVEEAPRFAPDLFLLDVMMPDMGGEETWHELRKLPGLETVPAIFMTAKAQASVAEALIANGAIGVISKPFDPMTLCAEIRTIWDAR
jgi:CheY-like chemotaxis protein